MVSFLVLKINLSQLTESKFRCVKPDFRLLTIRSNL
jgi:hypothetical protein